MFFVLQFLAAYRVLVDLEVSPRRLPTSRFLDGHAPN